MDSTKIIKILAVLAGGYLLYEWLQKNGYWAQWFGTTAPALPAAPATTQTPAATITAPPPATAPDPALVNALIQTGTATPSTLYNIWQWNAVLNQYKPGSANVETSDNSQTMTAAQYVALRQSKGLSGLVTFYPWTTAYPRIDLERSRLAGMHAPWRVQ